MTNYHEAMDAMEVLVIMGIEFRSPSIWWKAFKILLKFPPLLFNALVFIAWVVSSYLTKGVGGLFEADG